MSAGSKIIEGLKEAVRGDFARVTIEGQTWVRADRAAPPVGLTEEVIQSLINSTIDPLKRLGERLADLLQEDDWNNIEPFLLDIAARLNHQAGTSGDLRGLIEEVLRAGAGKIGSSADPSDVLAETNWYARAERAIRGDDQ